MGHRVSDTYSFFVRLLPIALRLIAVVSSTYPTHAFFVRVVR